MPRTLSLVVWLVLVGGGRSALAAPISYYLAVDVPTILSGQDVVPSQIATLSGGAYAIEAALDPSISIGALHRRPDGTWLLSPEAPITIGLDTWEPRDVVSFDGVVYTTLLSGAALGIPADARIDALMEDPVVGVVVSFDVPVMLAGIDRAPSDLVALPGFALYWDSAAWGIPDGVNVAGADLEPSGALVVTFDAPFDGGGTDYLPGQLVSVAGATLASFALDPGWPAGTVMRDFSFLPAAGTVPDGSLVPGTPLMATKAPGRVELAWAASCNPADADYAVYEGTLGDFASHQPAQCSTSGATTAALPASVGSSYYLVVPRNAQAEGSYGVATAGAERPPSPAACLPQQVATCP